MYRALLVLAALVVGLNVAIDPACDAPGVSWYKPPSKLYWQWYLQMFTFDSSVLKPTQAYVPVSFYDIDLSAHSPDAVAKLKQAGYKVACYFEAGTYVATRPWAGLYNKGSCTAAQVGKQVCGDLGLPYAPPYQDELWVNVSSPTLRSVMTTILDEAQKQGCDMVEPDNVQGHEEDTGYRTGMYQCTKYNAAAQSASMSITYKYSSGCTKCACTKDYDLWLDFNKFMAREAHKRGMGILLKNNIYQATSLKDCHDGLLSESCMVFDECGYYAEFQKTGKPVLMTIYNKSVYNGKMCSTAQTLGFNAIGRSPALGSPPTSPYVACCNGKIASASNVCK